MRIHPVHWFLALVASGLFIGCYDLTLAPYEVGSGGASGIGGATGTGSAVGFGGMVGTGGAVGIDAPIVTGAGGTVGRDAAQDVPATPQHDR